MKHWNLIFLRFGFVVLAAIIPFLSAQAGETNPYADPRPCRIMMEQIEAFAKRDPLKGLSNVSFTDWGIAPETESERKRHFFQRAFAPGEGRAYFHQPMMGKAALKEYMKAQKMEFIRAFDLDDFYGSYTPRFYDLSRSSGYFIIAVSGGTAHCIHNETFKILDRKTRRGLLITQPSFGEGDLCDPSDLTVVNADGRDYILINNGSYLLDTLMQDRATEEPFDFYLTLFAPGAAKKHPTCDFRVQFKQTGSFIGIFSKVDSTPSFWTSP